MKRFTLFAVVISAIAAVIATPLASGAGDAKGPACYDIIGGDGGFNSNPDGSGTFGFSMTLSAPACKGASFTFYVSYNGGAFTPIQGVVDGATVTMPSQNYSNVVPNQSNVCVYAESAKPNGNVADRAPDGSCLTYILDSPPGNSSFS